jgi:hypothetical protein
LFNQFKALIFPGTDAKPGFISKNNSRD